MSQAIEKTSHRGFEVVRADMRTTDGDIQLPTRASHSSAGYDFYSPVDIYIPKHGHTGIIPTDVKAYMGDDEVLLLFIRSSIGIKKGIVLSNGTGVIDADYYSNPTNDGNIGIALTNMSDEDVILKKGERIMQGVFTHFMTADNKEEVTQQRIGGFGSTGSK